METNLVAPLRSRVVVTSAAPRFEENHGHSDIFTHFDGIEQRGYRFSRVAGTSAGAIVGLLVASGMTSDALYDLMIEVDYTRFRDETPTGHVPVLGHGLSMWFEHGMYRGEYFHGWIKEQLAALGVHTFGDLYRADPGSSFPIQEHYRLVVMTSDVSRGRLL